MRCACCGDGRSRFIPQRPQSSIESGIAHRQADPPISSTTTWRSRVEGSTRQSLEMLKEVGLGPVVDRLSGFPHEFSGGQMQRILIAIAALSTRPQLLLADEPTSTLDVTVQAQVLSLLSRVRQELGISIVIVTHDFGVIAQLCDRVCVMYHGELVETTDVISLFEQPQAATRRN